MGGRYFRLQRSSAETNRKSEKERYRRIPGIEEIINSNIIRNTIVSLLCSCLVMFFFCSSFSIMYRSEVSVLWRSDLRHRFFFVLRNFFKAVHGSCTVFFLCEWIMSMQIKKQLIFMSVWTVLTELELRPIFAIGNLKHWLCLLDVFFCEGTMCRSKCYRWKFICLFLHKF